MPSTGMGEFSHMKKLHSDFASTLGPHTYITMYHSCSWLQKTYCACVSARAPAYVYRRFLQLTARFDLAMVQPSRVERTPSPEEREGPSKEIAGVAQLDLQPPPAKKRLTLTGIGTRSSENGLQENDTSSETEAERAGSSAGVSENPRTLKNNRWAVAHFTRWLNSRNEQFAGDSENQVPVDILKSTDPKALTKWLALFAAEARKNDGGAFPRTSVYMLLAGLLRHMRSLDPTCPNFLSTTNFEFTELHRSLENTFRELQSHEVTSEPKKSEGFSREEEDRLWSSGALSTETPIGLLRAVFFLNGRNFGIVGGERHRQLKLSQLKRVANPPRYVYTASASDSNHSAPEHKGLTRMWSKKKKPSPAIIVDAVAEKGNRCHVHVLDLYLQKLPPEAFDNDVFYLQPLGAFKDPTKPWFTTNPFGKNMLTRMVKDICTDAGIDGVNKRNQSLRVSGATNQAGVYSSQESVSTNTPSLRDAVTSPQDPVTPQPHFIDQAQGTGEVSSQQQTITLSPLNSPAQLLHFVSNTCPVPDTSQQLAVSESPQRTVNLPPLFLHTGSPAQAAIHTNAFHHLATQNLAIPHANITHQPTQNSTIVDTSPTTQSQSTQTTMVQGQDSMRTSTTQQPTAFSPSQNTINPVQVQVPQAQAVPLTFNNCHVTIFITPTQPQP